MKQQPLTEEERNLVAKKQDFCENTSRRQADVFASFCGK